MPGTGNHQARYIANPYDARDDGKSSVLEFEEQGPPAMVIVVNILLHEKGIENGELALVI